VSTWTQGRVHGDASARLRGRVFLSSARTVKTCPRGKRGRPDETDVRTVNFTIERPFRHPYD
jgi:hypothetical protein